MALDIFLEVHNLIKVDMKRLVEMYKSLVECSGKIYNTIRFVQIKFLTEKCYGAWCIYKHHACAEVIFPAVDSLEKNMSDTYALAHERVSERFNELRSLLGKAFIDEEISNQKLATLAIALQETINDHMSEEEKQIFPVLKKLTSTEQASLERQFLCSIPVIKMAKFLSWISSSSLVRREQMIKWVDIIIPHKELAKQIVSKLKLGEDGQTENRQSSCESPQNANRDPQLSENHPVDDILSLHRAIQKELNFLAAAAARRSKPTVDTPHLSDIDKRLQFIAEVCIFYSIAVDKVIFPAVDVETSSVEERAEEEGEFYKLIESIETAGANSPAEFYPKLCSQVAHIQETMKKRFLNVENQVIPLARMNLSPEKQRRILYHSICVMPHGVVQLVLPWFVNSLSKEEAHSFRCNINMAAPLSPFVTLFSHLALKCEMTGASTQSNACNASGIELPKDLLTNQVARRIGLRDTAKYLRSLSLVPTAPSLRIKQPIDGIFVFHTLIQKKLDFLDVESGKLGDCKEIFLTQFCRKVYLVRRLYKFYSDAEDDIVILALDLKSNLDDVRHYLFLDHKKVKNIFKDIASQLRKLEHNRKNVAGNLAESSSDSSYLAREIQDNFKYIKAVVDAHVKLVDEIIMPLFVKNLNAEEQTKLVGCLIGRIGADDLLSMLSGETPSLTQEERDKMLQIWYSASAKTKFSEWVKEMLEGTSESSSQVSTSETSFSQEYALSGRTASYWDSEQKLYGCKHYPRNYKLRAACCGKLFTCKLCHKEEAGHDMDGKATSEMMCMKCLLIQPVGQFCKSPICNGLSMAKYYCSICKYFDDARDCFHCPFCNFCLVGKGLGKSHCHCMRCNRCLNIDDFESHPCKDYNQIECPICLENLRTSSCMILGCGHELHSNCFGLLMKHSLKCPFCREPVY